MSEYYHSLAALRERLSALGATGDAAALLTAERSSTTSGEVISNVRVVLQELMSRGSADRLGLLQDVETVLRIGDELWEQSNRA
jgi:hypothetical protein